MYITLPLSLLPPIPFPLVDLLGRYYYRAHWWWLLMTPCGMPCRGRCGMGVTSGAIFPATIFGCCPRMPRRRTSPSPKPPPCLMLRAARPGARAALAQNHAARAGGLPRRTVYPSVVTVMTTGERHAVHCTGIPGAAATLPLSLFTP